MLKSCSSCQLYNIAYFEQLMEIIRGNSSRHDTSMRLPMCKVCLSSLDLNVWSISDGFKVAERNELWLIEMMVMLHKDSSKPPHAQSDDSSCERLCLKSSRLSRWEQVWRMRKSPETPNTAFLCLYMAHYCQVYTTITWCSKPKAYNVAALCQSTLCIRLHISLGCMQKGSTAVQVCCFA